MAPTTPFITFGLSSPRCDGRTVRRAHGLSLGACRGRQNIVKGAAGAAPETAGWPGVPRVSAPIGRWQWDLNEHFPGRCSASLLNWPKVFPRPLRPAMRRRPHDPRLATSSSHRLRYMPSVAHLAAGRARASPRPALACPPSAAVAKQTLDRNSIFTNDGSWSSRSARETGWGETTAGGMRVLPMTML